MGPADQYLDSDTEPTQVALAQPRKTTHGKLTFAEDHPLFREL
jgi:hypothetical protein